MGTTVSLDTATALIDAAEQRANAIENPMVIAVVNDEGNLVAQHRVVQRIRSLGGSRR